jgi:metal-responsive CopG/Arc/MetJ family transcriptional regulator
MAKISYNTRMDEDLLKQFKILAIMESKRQNELLEEAIKDLLKKYEKKQNNLSE